MSYDYHEYALSVRITEGCIRILIFTWCGLLAITFLYKLRRYKQNTGTTAKQISKQTTIPALTTFICWFLSYLITSIDTLSGIFWEISETTQTMIWFTFAIIYSIGMIASYMFVVLLLYQSFKGSQFEISKCTVIINIVMIITLCVTCSTATFLLYIIPHWLGDAMTTMNVMIYVFALCILVCILNSKLIKAILIVDNDGAKKPKQGHRFLNTITKLSVLMSTYTFTAVIYVSFAAIHVFYTADIMKMFSWILYGILLFTGTSCQYLTFSFNHDHYNKICGVCHHGVFRCCTYIVSKRRSDKKGSEPKDKEGTLPKMDLVVASRTASRKRVLSVSSMNTDGDHTIVDNEWKKIDISSANGSEVNNMRIMMTMAMAASSSTVEDTPPSVHPGEDGLPAITRAISAVISTSLN